jgi:hypothetical protein
MGINGTPTIDQNTRCSTGVPPGDEAGQTWVAEIMPEGMFRVICYLSRCSCRSLARAGIYVGLERRRGTQTLLVLP